MIRVVLALCKRSCVHPCRRRCDAANRGAVWPGTSPAVIVPFQGKNSPLNLSQLPSKWPEQAKNISYSTSDGFGEGNFLVQILCGGSVIGIRLILHQLPLPRKSLKRGKIILVSTSRWEVANQYGIRYRNDHRIGQDP